MCWYSTVDETALEYLNINFDRFMIDINCNTPVGCSGPAFVDADEASKTQAAKDQVTIVFNNLMKAFARNLMGAKSDEAINRKRRESEAICNCNSNPDITKEGPRGEINMATSYSPEKQYTASQELKMSAIEVCEEDVSIPAPYGNGAKAGIPQPIIITALIAFAYFVVTRLLKCLRGFFRIVRKVGGDHQKKIVAQRALARMKRREANKARYDLFKGDTCLHFSPSVAPWMKYFVPTALVICIMCFMLSHTSVLASVDIKLTFGGQVIDLRGFAVMMLKESLESMWKAKVSVTY